MQRLYIIFALYFVAFSYAAVGVINVDNSNNIYLNNFNTLANTGTSNTWTEGSTINGWYAYKGNSATNTYNAITTYRADTGTTTTDGLYSYGASASSDRSLGMIYTGGSFGNFYIGAKFHNADATRHISSILLTYTGEQWRKGSDSPPHNMVVRYSLDNDDPTGLYKYPSAFTNKEDMYFKPPATGSNGAVNGENSQNRKTLSGGWDVNIPAGQDFWLAFALQSTGSGTSNGLAIDDLNVTFTFTDFGTPSTTFLVDTTSAVISEDFDTLPNDGDQYTFSDGLETATTFTLPGWLSYSTASYPRVLSLDSVSTHSNYHTFPVYSWSNTTEAAASDLKLGFFPHSRDGTNEIDVFAGITAQNNEATLKIIKVNITYDVSQMYCGATDPAYVTYLDLQYSLTNTALSDPTWTTLTGVRFTSDSDCLTGEFTDGSDPATYATKTTVVDLHALNKDIVPGGKIMFRWSATLSDGSVADSDFNGLAIDNVIIAFEWESSTTTTTGSSGDPHFFGYLGQKYDFMGQSYEIYNIITSPYLQINSAFTPYYRTANQVVPTGTMLGALGIKFYNHRIYANSNSSVIVMDGQDVNMKSDWVVNYEHGITISNNPVNGRFILTIETPDISISFIQKVYLVQGLEPQWHYDYKSKMLKVNEEFHGLLGQTWEGKFFVEKSGAFQYLDGDGDDYRLNSHNIFGDDFTFNKFMNM